MNCSNHQDVSAVAKCANCGVGLCSNCVNSSEFTIDNVALCRECNYKLINENIENDRNSRFWLLVKIIFGAIFMILGLAIYISTGQLEDGIVFWALSGLPTGWKFVQGDAESRARERLDDAVADLKNTGGGLLNSIVRFIFKLIIALAIATVAAPVLLVINVVKYYKLKNTIIENEELLNAFVK